MDYNKIEDSVLKKAMEVFRQSAVGFFGINTSIIAPAETEIKNIEIKTGYTDYLFYTEDGNYLHFEFQTTDRKDDIKRFLYYDASLFYKEKRKIRTIVIYSSGIDIVEDHIDAGTIKYRIEPFYMGSLNGDEKLEYIEEKILNKQNLTPEDILTLTLVPLMGGKESRSTRTLHSIDLAEKISSSENKLQCLSMLYALLEKFGDDEGKRKFKEVFSMTEIGKMIREDGIKEGELKGRAEGKEEGKAELLIKQLTKKFKKLPDEYKQKIKTLSEETIDIIAVDIFEINSIDELKQYF